MYACIHINIYIYIFKDEMIIKQMKRVHTCTLIVYDRQLHRKNIHLGIDQKFSLEMTDLLRHISSYICLDSFEKL